MVLTGDTTYNSATRVLAMPSPWYGHVRNVTWPGGHDAANPFKLTFQVSTTRCYSPLLSVTNSLGRSLSFGALSGTSSDTVVVTAGDGRTVSLTPDAVTLPDNSVIRYSFDGPDMPYLGVQSAPDPTGSRLTAVYLPGDPADDFAASSTHTAKFLSLAYDDLDHVTLTDAQTRVTSYFVGGLARSARTEVKDPPGRPGLHHLR